MSKLDRRQRLARARLYLIFTPHAVAGGNPERVLAEVMPEVDVLQIRVKLPDRELDPARARVGAHQRSAAREAWTWCQRALELRRRAAAEHVLLIVNDRVDVARSLRDEGLDGVHVGLDDTPPRVARELLGPEALIGWSTHAMRDVAAAHDEPVDYIGFGPIRASATKGYARGLGAEAAWVAAQASALPVFPIGGIGLANVSDLAEVGRAAVARAILAAQRPAEAARALRRALQERE
jgi:thiamine-phosphate pyrophosphorylase